MKEHRDRAMQRIYSERGLATKIANRLGIARQSLQQWRRVPAGYVLDIADMLDMTPEQIRPDVFKPRRRA